MTRKWSPRELARVRSLCARRVPWPTIAVLLRRSESACYQAALDHRLYEPRLHRRHGHVLHEQIRRYHSYGATDVEIGAALHINRAVIGHHRRKLGLPSNAWSLRRRSQPNSGQFAQGCRRGRAAQLYGFIGQTRVRCVRCRRGRGNWKQVWIKIRDDGPMHQRWIPFGRHVWQRLHGPVPPGMLVVHANGDTLDDDPANLRLISRRELPAWLRTIRPEMESRRRAAVTRATRRRGHARRELRALRRAHQPEAVAC